MYDNNNVSLTLVSGPINSGKSRWAEALYKDKIDLTYFATSNRYPDDSIWLQKIQIHRNRRPREWNTIETCNNLIVDLPTIHKTKYVLIDSLGGFVTYGLSKSDNEWNQLSNFFTTEILNHSGEICIVIEEVGWSLLPHTSSGLLFSERLTMLSQSLYKYSTQSWLVLNGRAIDIQTYGILIP